LGQATIWPGAIVGAVVGAILGFLFPGIGKALAWIASYLPFP
jgi:hypothetical protein